MKGISFRFEDLRRMFYIEKEHLKKKTKNKVIVPKLFPLSTNYRSHTGILDLAASVIDLMKAFFPSSFDNLERDHGYFSGSKPVLIRSTSFGNLAKLLKGTKSESGNIELGARQVILVDNEEAKNSLPKEFPKELAHTVFEAKGLEFNDVLLYNIFKNSKDKKIWRVVTDHLDNLMDSYQGNTTNQDCTKKFQPNELEPVRPRPVRFDPKKHKVLNSELKYLYTAVTRARFNLWIFDEDETARKPMFEYLRVLNLVRTTTETNIEGEKDASSFVKESSPLEWEEQGNVYFQEKMYSSAAHCYGKAGHTTKQKVSLALGQIKGLSPGMQEYLNLAEDLLEGNMIPEALACLRNARHPLLVGRLLEKLGKTEEALRIYTQHNLMKEVLRINVQQEGENKTLEIMLRLDMYDEAADKYEILSRKTNNNFLRTENAFPAICRAGAAYYHTLKDTESMKYVLERHPKSSAAAEILVQLESKCLAYAFLHDGLSIVDPVKSLESQVSQLLKSKDWLWYTYKETFIEVLQVLIVTALCQKMRHSKDNVFLPSGYVENIHFWEYVYKLENKHPSIFHSIHNHEMSKQGAEDLHKSMLMLIEFMVGKGNGEFCAISCAFMGCHEVDYDIYEKLLGLSLVWIINLLQEGTIDILNHFTRRLLHALEHFPTAYYKKSFPPQIKQLFFGITDMNTKLKLYEKLVKFLSAKKEKLLLCEWNQGNELKTSEYLPPAVRKKLQNEHVFGCQCKNDAKMSTEEHSKYWHESHGHLEREGKKEVKNKVKKRGKKTRRGTSVNSTTSDQPVGEVNAVDNPQTHKKKAVVHFTGNGIDKRLESPELDWFLSPGRKPREKETVSDQGVQLKGKERVIDGEVKPSWEKSVELKGKDKLLDPEVQPVTTVPALKLKQITSPQVISSNETGFSKSPSNSIPEGTIAGRSHISSKEEPKNQRIQTEGQMFNHKHLEEERQSELHYPNGACGAYLFIAVVVVVVLLMVVTLIYCFA